MEGEVNQNSPDLFSEESADFQHEIGLEDLPTLLSLLDKKEKRESLPQTLHSLLSSFLHLIPLPVVEHQLLQFVLPATKNFFIEIFLEIKSSLESFELQCSDSVVDILHEHLQVGLNLLECLNSLLVHLSSLGKVKVRHVSSVPLNVAEILLETFKHCKNSASEYGAKLPLVQNKLVTVFQKAHQVQLSFLSFLHNNLVFVCSYEDDMELLTKVMGHLGSLGEAIEGLDAKSMVEQWKGYTRLAQTYVDYLRPTLNVARPISFLCGNIVGHLSKLISQNEKGDPEQMRRNVKMSYLELKVVFKLIELYHDYLGDCHRQLLMLLCHLNMCLPSYLVYKRVAFCVADDMGKQLFIGACPLLAHLISDRAFIKEYIGFTTELQSSSQELKLAYLLLTIAIMKKIVRIDKEVQEIWLRSLTVIVVVLASLHYCHSVLCLDVEIEGDKALSMYEALLINTTVLICNTVKSCNYPVLEELLVSQIMKPFFWPAIFASDLIVLICRFGSSELCFSLTQQLCEVLVEWRRDKSCPEWIYITRTTGRLFNLLTTNAKLNLLSRYPPKLHLTLWKHLSLSALPTQERNNCCLDLIKKVNSDIYKFLNGSSDITSYNNMIESVSLVENCVSSVTSLSDVYSEVSALATSVFRLWQCISLRTDMNVLESSVSGVQWLYSLFSTLITATVPILKFFTVCQLLFILECVTDGCNVGVSSCRLSGVELLYAFSTTKWVEDNEYRNVLLKISTLYAKLLNDNDPLIKCLSLELFEYFSSITSCELIVRKTIEGDEELQNLITNFVQRLPVTTTLVTEENDFLSQRSIFKHKCEAVVLPQLASSKTIDLEVADDTAACVALQRMLKDSEFINEHFRGNEATSSEQTLLIKVFEEVNKLKQFCKDPQHINI